VVGRTSKGQTLPISPSIIAAFVGCLSVSFSEEIDTFWSSGSLTSLDYLKKVGLPNPIHALT